MNLPQSPGVRFDPRTKLFVVLVAALVVAFSPAKSYQYCFVIAVCIFAAFCGRWRFSAIGLSAYALLQAILWYATHWLAASTLGTMLVAGLGFFNMIFPCGIAAGLTISSTRVSELLAAAVRLRIPGRVYIPLAVLCRYFPSVKEDWRFIRSAMKLRGLTLSPASIVRQPAATIECLYVPLMMSAAKAADELSAAAISRGIESPRPRTCISDLHIRPADVLVMVLFGLAVPGMFLWGVFGL